MSCPHCGSNCVGVDYTIKLAGYVYRDRRCKVCDMPYQTIEVPLLIDDEELDIILDMERKHQHIFKQEAKPKKKEKPKTLSQIAADAKAAGMSYGEYMIKVVNAGV